jgi:hypothetical protein
MPVPESVAGAFEGDDVCVVDDAVDHGGGDDQVSEDARRLPACSSNSAIGSGR